jgi:CheY-like chemotaxis protein
MAKILIVDDVSANRELLSSVLGYRGHECVEAANGVQALEQVRAWRPDLVICDVFMPRMDGYEFTRALRAEPDSAGTKVIFHTSYTLSRACAARALACGVIDFLMKPCEPEEIFRVTDAALNFTAGE